MSDEKQAQREEAVKEWFEKFVSHELGAGFPQDGLRDVFRSGWDWRDAALAPQSTTDANGTLDREALGRICYEAWNKPVGMKSWDEMAESFKESFRLIGVDVANALAVQPTDALQAARLEGVKAGLNAAAKLVDGNWQLPILGPYSVLKAGIMIGVDTTLLAKAVRTLDPLTIVQTTNT